MTTRRRPTLSVDFDGVLHAYVSGWQGADVVGDGPVPGAVAFLAEAVEHFEVSIYSSRSETPEGVEAMRVAVAAWIAAEYGEAGLLIYEDLRFPVHKPPALVALDDRAVTFTGVFPPIDELRAFVPWNKAGLGLGTLEPRAHKLSDGAELEVVATVDRVLVVATPATGAPGLALGADEARRVARDLLAAADVVEREGGRGS